MRNELREKFDLVKRLAKESQKKDLAKKLKDLEDAFDLCPEEVEVAAKSVILEKENQVACDLLIDICEALVSQLDRIEEKIDKLETDKK